MSLSANKSTETAAAALADALASRLDPHPWARQIRVLPTTSSTNDEVLALARQGAPHGTTVIALDQTAGRGRHGRAWVSQPGDSLCLSVLLRDHLPSPGSPCLTLTAGLAAHRALTSLTGLSLHIKWPNDILWENRKLCGILAESAALGTEAHTVIGIGVNLNQRAQDFPPELRSIATSLSLLTGRTWDLAECAATLIHELHDALQLSPSDMLRQWKARCTGLGRHIRIATPEGDLSGILHDLDADGALLFQPTGAPAAQRIVSAEILA